MKRLLVYALLLVGAYYLIGGSDLMSEIRNGNAALVIRGMTNAELNATIIDHYKETVLNGMNDFTANDIDTTITDLNDDGKKDVIAIVTSDATCGTGGCIASIFLEDDIGELVAIPFEYAVKEIEVLESITRDMHDLRVNNDTSRRLVWDGVTYVPEEI